LIDAEVGRHLWAERFDKPVANLLDMQNEIVTRLASQLDVELIVAEARRADENLNPDATDLMFQGWAAFHRGWFPELMAKASNFFDRALSLDPNNLRALYGKAVVEIVTATNFQVDDPAARLGSAETTLSKILSVDPRNALTHWSLGSIQSASGRNDLATLSLERAIALDPNLAGAHAALGIAKLYVGRAAETEAHILKALRLSPRDALEFNWNVNCGIAKAYLGHFDEAAIWLRKSFYANSNYPPAHFFLAGILAHLGKAEEARLLVKSGLTLDPGFRIGRIRKGVQSNHPAYVEFFNGALEAMRDAGVPD
jgi:tetratricopeptide (TPR) repeat protein